MTKWGCRCENYWCKVETSGFAPDSCLYDRTTNPRWKNEDESSLKGRKDTAIKRIVSIQDANIEEMARNIAALKEQIADLDARLDNHVTSPTMYAINLENRMTALEHQMRRHFHDKCTPNKSSSVYVWNCEGTGITRLI